MSDYNRHVIQKLYSDFIFKSLGGGGGANYANWKFRSASLEILPQVKQQLAAEIDNA